MFRKFSFRVNREDLDIDLDINPVHVHMQWCRQLWGTGARAPSQLPTVSFLVHFGVNLRANYSNIV